MPMFEDVLLSSQSISSGQANGSSENADSVTGAGNPSAPMDSGNNLKQLGIALHALDAGECNVDICAKNSPSASLEPVTHTGWGPWEAVLGGQSSSPANTGYVNPSSFQIVSAGEQFYSRENGGGGDFGHADILFGAADNPPLSEDLGIAWVSGDGGTRDHGNNDVILIHNLTGVDGLYGDHGSSILEFSVENFPNNSSDTPDTLSADVGGQFYARESAPGVGCDDLISGDNSASPAPLESRGYRAGHFALEIEGQFASHLSLYDLIV